jgi:hypothetical protein
LLGTRGDFCTHGAHVETVAERQQGGAMAHLPRIAQTHNTYA